MSHVQKWKEAWPYLADAVREEVLAKMGPFPSLYANDYIHALEAKGVDVETMKFIKALKRELDFAYDNWSRSALSPDNLLKDLCSSISSITPGADTFYQIIANYRATHNIGDPSSVRSQTADWMNPVEAPPEQTPPP